MLFDRTVDGLTAVVHYAGLRHKTIANNIANLDTPGYKALDISFREQLRDLMETPNGREQRVRHSVSSTTRNPSSPHALRSISRSVSLMPPTVMFAPDANALRPRIDSNTVNIDQELIKVSQNSILHNSCLQLLRGKFRTLRSAISGNV